MLNYFGPKLNTEVICDASPYGISATLIQYREDEIKKRVVAYTRTKVWSNGKISFSYTIWLYKVSSLSFGKRF